MLEKKWYQETWTIIIISIIIPPIGFILAITNPHYSTRGKKISGSVIAFWFVLMLISDQMPSSPNSAFDKAVEEGFKENVTESTIEDTVPNTTVEETPVEEPAEPKPTGIAVLTENEIKDMVEDADTLAEKVKAYIEKDTGWVEIIFERSDSWDANAMVFGTCLVSKTVMPKLFDTEGVKAVTVKLDSSFTDQYGKSSKETAVLIALNKETANKVDWEGLDGIGRAAILNIADTKDIHPAVLKEVNNEDIIAAYEN